ncbi:MAG: fumarylacetoacetate hydrolase [Candidatus Eisenbacteria bacterium]|nr:fumarylacetoacetate hydrolase [Candidatus Eisenbacteria bacterium]
MRWLNFFHEGRVRPGLLLPDQEHVIDLTREDPGAAAPWEIQLESGGWRALAERLQNAGWVSAPLPLAGLRLAPPLTRPSKVVAIGLNYRDHAAEQNRTPPEEPLLFAKASSCLIGHESPIVVPAQEERPDVEAELAFVVGRTARDVSPGEALDCIAGITAMNDVSGRAAQYGDRQWFRGKSYDTFGPLGPWVVTLEEIPDLQGLRLQCRVNGETRQDGTTADMIFGVRELLSYISRQMTLWPGDVVSTGTPAGVGVFRDPPLFLQDGDVVEVELERVGVLRNPVTRPTSSADRS